MRKKAPKYGFGTSRREALLIQDDCKVELPGPGSYASKTFIGKESQGKSMGIKFLDMSLERNKTLVPGPGTYRPENSPMKNHPSCKIGTELREKKSNYLTPASNHY